MAAISIARERIEARRTPPRLPQSREIRTQDFTDYFDYGLATTPEQRNDTFKIRGDVYCKEFHYEPEEKCVDGLETDDFDPHAIHTLITHRASGMPAGCVRVILPTPGGPVTQLPFEAACTQSLTHPTLRPSLVPRDQQLEVSRLAVHTTFRRRSGENAAPDGLAEIHPFGDSERRSFPLIGNVLSLTGVALADLLGREHIFVMIEPRLARMLKYIGLNLTQIGDLIDYHGMRAAFYLNTEQAIQSIKPEVREIFLFLQRRLWKDIYSNIDHPLF